MSSKWIIRPKIRKEAKVRLICFPHAGSSSVVTYKFLVELLPNLFDVCLVELPGRGLRMNETLDNNIHSVVDGIAGELYDYRDLPLIFFGHSMGALISYELTRKLHSEYNIEPYKLYISSHRAPFSEKESKLMHELEEEEFKTELEKMNGIAADIWENKELMNIMLPIIKNDFKLCETYKYSTADKLNCEITAFGGINDIDVTKDHLYEWQSLTRNQFNIHMFEGDHFYLFKNKEKFLEVFSEYLKDDLNNI